MSSEDFPLSADNNNSLSASSAAPPEYGSSRAGSHAQGEALEVLVAAIDPADQTRREARADEQTTGPLGVLGGGASDSAQPQNLQPASPGRGYPASPFVGSSYPGSAPVPEHIVPDGNSATWQPRPSGAFSAEAWSTPTTGYPIPEYPAANQPVPSPAGYGTVQYPRPEQPAESSAADIYGTQLGSPPINSTPINNEYSQYATAQPNPYDTNVGNPNAGSSGSLAQVNRGFTPPGAGYGAAGFGPGTYGPAGYSPSSPSTGSFSGSGYPYLGYGQPSYAIAPNPAAGNTTTDPIARPRRRRGALAAAAVVLALAAGGIGGFIGAGIQNHNAVSERPLSQRTTSPVVSVNTPVVAGSVESVAAKLLPSVVSILAISASQEAEGSGIILSSDGLILTNNHVIAGASNLTVKFNDGTTGSAKVVGSDATDDLAVIKISGVSGLTVATLGSSAKVKVGEQVVAVGSPLGLSATVTSGIISALNRPVRTAAEQTQGQSKTQGQSTSNAQDTVLNAIQTDAAINPGNSGGALVDMTGAVIGINSAIASLSSSSSSSQSGSIGVGFAIPIDQAHRIAQEIINTGHANHAVLGASVGDAPDGTTAAATAAAAAGLSVGAKIAQVTSGGAAASGGLVAGDVITKIDGVLVSSADALIATVRSSTPGGKVQVTYLRGSTSMTATITLGSAISN